MQFNKKIYVIGAQHGNETFGLKVLGYLEGLANPAIVIRVGNPLAIAKKRRFIETDLNRSYKNVTSFEGHLAESIILEVERFLPDIIVDIHTSTANVGKAAIFASTDKILANVAKFIGMEYAAAMPKPINEASLIGQFPDRALSLELGVGLRSDNLAKKIAQNINALAMGGFVEQVEPHDFYMVERLISKEEGFGATLENYIFNERLKGYPFLAGESNYTEHCGFLATEIIKV